MRKAEYFTALQDKHVKCGLCPRNCVIRPGEKGRCLGRVNINGELFADNYGKMAAFSMDPIEKKPLFHFAPGSRILSVASYGCNLSCRWCQNWDLSQQEREYKETSPEDLLGIMGESGTRLIAFTYSEPLMWYEYIRDFAEIAGEDADIVLVTNGYINHEPLDALLSYISAVNIDLKAMDSETYMNFTGGRLDVILDNIRAFYKAGIHTEITYLLVPGVNDSSRCVKRLAEWLASELDENVPIHLSRYFPAYRMTAPPTPAETMEKAYHTASEHLNYVYTGNMGGQGHEDTVCPHCGNILIQRTGYRTRISGMDKGRCTRCGGKADIILR